MHDHSSGHSVANPHGCKSGLRRALWVVIEIEIDVAATRSQWDDKDGGTAMRWDGSDRSAGAGTSDGRVQCCDVRIAFCFALLSDANAFWYDHSTSSVR